MIKTAKSFFHLAIMFTNEETKLFFFFIYSLRSLRHDQERRNFFFHLATMFTNEGAKMILFID